LRVKPCVVDWQGDGRLSILLGDRCGSFNAKPAQTPQEKAEEIKANDRLPELRRKWADAFARYRQASGEAEKPAAGKHEAKELQSLREEVRRFKEEIVKVQDIQERYRPGYQAHGFVWLFERQPAAPKGPKP
jgi:hypothetical protein